MIQSRAIGRPRLSEQGMVGPVGVGLGVWARDGDTGWVVGVRGGIRGQVE